LCHRLTRSIYLQIDQRSRVGVGAQLIQHSIHLESLLGPLRSFDMIEPLLQGSFTLKTLFTFFATFSLLTRLEYAREERGHMLLWELKIPAVRDIAAEDEHCTAHTHTLLSVGLFQ